MCHSSLVMKCVPAHFLKVLSLTIVAIVQHTTIAESKAEFPLVIFSHGIGGNRLAYSAIICSLVRQVGNWHTVHS